MVADGAGTQLLPRCADHHPRRADISHRCPGRVLVFNHPFADGGQTLIISRLTTIELADVIYMHKDGRLVERGTHDALVALRGEFHAMFESQV
ncbi:hypothetical protein ABIB56_000760 [Glaciihabitans sp. UYNi722]